MKSETKAARIRVTWASAGSRFFIQYFSDPVYLAIEEVGICFIFVI